jgi:hypothetical protein
VNHPEELTLTIPSAEKKQERRINSPQAVKPYVSNHHSHNNSISMKIVFNRLFVRRTTAAWCQLQH